MTTYLPYLIHARSPFKAGDRFLPPLVMQITQEQIDFLEQPKECFFYYQHPKVPPYYTELKCPGWVFGQIHLPLVRDTSLFLLVKGLGGELHWLPAPKITLIP
jgi:hypothetical protein